MRILFRFVAIVLLGTTLWAQSSEERSWFLPYWLVPQKLIPDFYEFRLGGVFASDAEDVPGGTIGFDPGFATGLGMGWRLMEGERLAFDLKLEAMYQYFTVDEDDLPAITSATQDDAKVFVPVMVTGELDWRFTPQFALYGGAGVGYASVIKYSAWDSGNLEVVDDDGLAFQALLGTAYNLGGSCDVRLGYRYFQTEPVDIRNNLSGQVDELDVGQHSVEAIFRWGL